MQLVLKVLLFFADVVRFVLNWIYVIAIYLSKLMLIALVVVTSVQVFMRYVLGGGFRGAQEIALILVVWFTFIAMALGVKRDLHISINVLPSKLPVWVAFVLARLKALVVLLVAFVMVYYGRDLFHSGMRSILPATRLPAGVQHLAIPVAGFLMLYDGFMDLFGFDKKDTYVSDRIFKEMPSEVPTPAGDGVTGAASTMDRPVEDGES